MGDGDGGLEAVVMRLVPRDGPDWGGDVVEALERALSVAREGGQEGIAIVMFSKGGQLWGAGRCRNRLEFLGALQLMCHDLLTVSGKE